jgi:hypothetical protein
MINPRLPNYRSSNEAIWLLSSYVREVWSSLHVKGVAELNEAQFFGFLNSSTRMMVVVVLHVHVLGWATSTWATWGWGLCL